jgi:hypothetical protein
MLSHFECLHCGVMTVVEATPPTCGQCGHGTGVLHLQTPESLERDPAKDPKEQSADSSEKPEGTSGMHPASARMPTP